MWLKLGLISANKVRQAVSDVPDLQQFRRWWADISSWNAFTQHYETINVSFPHADSAEPDVYRHMSAHSFPAKLHKRDQIITIPTQTISPSPRGSVNAFAAVKPSRSPSTHAPPPGWFPRNLGSARLQPHQQQKSLKVEAADLKVGQIQGETHFTTILSLTPVLGFR